MLSFAKLARFLILGFILPATPAMAEPPITQLTIEQTVGGERIKTRTMIGSAFVASVSENNQLNSLYDSDTKELWLLDHDRQVAQLISQTEVHLFADRLASEVAKFEASIACLPEEERDLSMLRFGQLFARAGKKAVSHVDDFVAQNIDGEFAGIKCQWHNLIAHHSDGDQLLGTACLANTEAFAHGPVLAAFFAELAEFFDIVEQADTGPIPFPVTGNPMALAAHQGMLAIKVIPNLELYSSEASMEVVSVSTEAHSRSEYQIPDSYRRSRFSSAGAL
ncbi:hypothetical protein [Marinobacter halophilus]|uniref:DUF4412 domain-containing protein n=1 Tax=Marinobacter halophilus TaxID=1323740 RepID=A0A2T1KD35_9GAMM|nr:hypothetical protein [Marinobacter halophilus]PSF08036.1 hypothetical protein C7H08_11625 [Marinobacter halophilus]GGC59214.1 hypothetical protein GCM10011362_04550 [Marinobacter halophilus]